LHIKSILSIHVAEFMNTIIGNLIS
jgi:hypothetical protein